MNTSIKEDKHEYFYTRKNPNLHVSIGNKLKTHHIYIFGSLIPAISISSHASP